MMNHRWSSAKLLRVEPDGTKVYRKNNKEYRVGGRPKLHTLEEAMTKADEIHRKTGVIVAIEKQPWPGFYPPGGRRAMYRGRKDPRETPEFAEAVRDRRRQGFKAGVKPGPQCL
jgi:hypothetical protein